GKFPFLHRAIGQVLSGVGDRTVLLIGDSIFAGNFSDVGQGPIPAMVKMLSGAGINAQFGLSGPQNTGQSGPDGRYTFGASWAIQAPASKLGWGAQGNYIL